ncbi:Zn-dependent protease [Rickettsiales bacterium Ac37b]|nr:Zn-dependent protease [Rickettsiales bacterium Ac37b]
MHNTTDLIKFIIDESLKKGADIAEVIQSSSQSLSVSTRLAKRENVKNAESQAIGLRVIIDGKQSLVATNDFNKDSLHNLISKAILMAKSVPEDPYIDIANTPVPKSELLDLQLYDDTLMDLSTLTDLAKQTEEEALNVNGITNSNGAKATYGINSFIISNSIHNEIYSYITSLNSISVSIVAGTGTDMQTDYYYSMARFAGDLESPHSIGTKAANLALKKLFPKKIITNNIPVVFAPRVASSILSDFIKSINGYTIAKGASFLKDKLHTPIFSSAINITDDPWRTKGIYSTPFDDECVKNPSLNLVQDGILTNWLLDLSSAKKLGLQSNGRAQRSFSSVPMPGSTNVFFHPGISSPQDLISNIKYGFYVTDLFSTDLNLVTGDYSRGAAGFAIENGVITYPVNEVTIASNLLSMFKTLSLANDLEFRYGIDSPTLLIPSMMVGGV